MSSPDDAISPNALRFYNEFGNHILQASVEAISDIFKRIKGAPLDADTQERIALVIKSVWDTAKVNKGVPAAEIFPREEHAVDTICALLAEAAATSVDLAPVKPLVAIEVKRALVGFLEGTKDITRHIAIHAAGVDPNDPRLR